MGRHPEKYGVVCGYSQRSAARDGEAAREASRRREQQRASAAALSMGLENLHNSRAGGGGHKDGQRAAGGCSALAVPKQVRPPRRGTLTPGTCLTHGWNRLE